MNVLNLVKDVCYQINIPAPSSLVGSTDPSNLQLLSLYNQVGRGLTDYAIWPFLKRTAQITTVASQSTYALPSDFSQSIIDTEWDVTNRWRMIGPLTDAEFDNYLNGYVPLVNRTAFRFFGLPSSNQIEITPTPGTNGDIFEYDYVSDGWVRTVSNTYITAVAADTDSSVFSDNLMILGLKFEYYKAKGILEQYPSAFSDFQKARDEEYGRYFQAKRVNMRGRNLIPAGLNPNVPEGNWS